MFIEYLLTFASCGALKIRDTMLKREYNIINKIVTFSISGALIYIALVGLVYLLQDKIIFQPDSLARAHDFRFDHPFEEIWLKTEDGESIHSLYFKTKHESRGVVLYLHGNRGNLQRWGNYHEDFTNRGFDFYAIDYRGYGKSSGTPTETGLYRDARAAYNWLQRRYPAERIHLYGRSLGSGVASRLAMETSAASLVLETPYHNMKGVFELNAPFLLLPFPLRSAFPNDRHLGKVGCPVYIIQGTRDAIVPYESALRLRGQLTNPDNFLIIEGGNHHNLNTFPAYHSFLDRVLIAP